MHRPGLSGPAIATAVLLVPLAVLDRRLQATGGPGMIRFELAGSERSQAILRAWGRDGQRTARASLLLDFPFLVAYTTLNVRVTARTRTPTGGTALGPIVMAIQGPGGGRAQT